MPSTTCISQFSAAASDAAPSELKAFTQQLAGRRGLFERFSARGKMSSQTVKRSKNFNVAAFLRRMDRIIEANPAPRLFGN